MVFKISGKIWWLLVGGVVVLPMLAACNTTETDIEYGMTEAEAAQMAELGFINVDNAADATRIAGFTVAVPNYIPEGFSGSMFTVSQLGATLPGGTGAEVKRINVSQFYAWQEDWTVNFSLSQINLGLGLGENEPAEFCGRSGQRHYREAEGDTPALVTLSWEVDGMSYYIIGTLAGPLDEATLEQIVCSVET